MRMTVFRSLFVLSSEKIGYDRKLRQSSGKFGHNAANVGHNAANADQRAFQEPFDLHLRCLPMSHLYDTGHKWVITAFIY